MIGIDLVHIPEFKRQIDLGGDNFLQRAFHTAERSNGSPEHLAGIWAAKEAVLKAAQLKPGSWLEITIAHKPSGQPFAIVERHELEISIAHHGDYAVAVAVAP